MVVNKCQPRHNVGEGAHQHSEPLKNKLKNNNMVVNNASHGIMGEEAPKKEKKRAARPCCRYCPGGRVVASERVTGSKAKVATNL
jgi:hypothetical protein